MIDTVNYGLGAYELGLVDFYQYMLPLVEDGGILTYGGNRTDTIGNIHEIRYYGKWVRLDYSRTGIRVEVKSYPQYLGDPLKDMTRNDMERATGELSNILQLPLDIAMVTRFDYGVNIVTDYPPTDYYPYLGVLDRLSRQDRDHGLLYKQGKGRGKWGFEIYDKMEDCRVKEKDIPEQYEGLNVMRLEMKIFKAGSYFGVGSVRGANLYEEDFYKVLLERWRAAYFRIEKIHKALINLKDIKLKDMEIKKVSQLKQVGLVALAKLAGGEMELIRQINECRERGELESKQALDMRKAVKEACKSEFLAERSSLIAELDKKIEEIK